jgi:hypothetical protein
MIHAVQIDPYAIDFSSDHPTMAYINMPCAFTAHGKRRAIARGERLALDYTAQPSAGDLVLTEDDELRSFGIGITRRDVVAVVID